MVKRNGHPKTQTMDKIFLIINKTTQRGHGDSWPVTQIASMSPYENVLCPSFPTREAAEAYIDFYKKHIVGDPVVLELPVYPNNLYTK